jgi:hypothetical protein
VTLNKIQNIEVHSLLVKPQRVAVTLLPDVKLSALVSTIMVEKHGLLSFWQPPHNGSQA